jgi:hypothetical protein
MSLALGAAALFVATGSFITDLIGVFDSPPAPMVAIPAPQATAPAPLGKSDVTIEFLKAEAQHASAKAQVAQAEIEALAAVQMPGDRSKIVERISELSVMKSDYEADARYYYLAIRQLAG